MGGNFLPFSFYNKSIETMIFENRILHQENKYSISRYERNGVFMKSNKIFAINIDSVADYAKCEIEKVGRIQMNSIFSNRKFKKLSEKVPKKFDDKDAIQNFFEETGLKVQYYVFLDQFSFIYYDRMGVHPDNDKWMMFINGEMAIEEFNSHPEYMESFEDVDIRVIIKGTDYKHLYYAQSEAFKNQKRKVMEFVKKMFQK